MRRRLKKFLPIVLIALVVQIFAPIGACWAASIAASDPLAGGRDLSRQCGLDHRDRPIRPAIRAHDGCCSVCSVLHDRRAGRCAADRVRSSRRSRCLRAWSGIDTRARPVRLPRRLPRPGPRATVHFLTRTSTTGAACAAPVNAVEQAGHCAGVRIIPMFRFHALGGVSRACNSAGAAGAGRMLRRRRAVRKTLAAGHHRRAAAAP